MKVKEFWDETGSSVQERINEWLEEMEDAVRVIDIKYTVTSHQTITAYALIMYDEVKH